MERRQILRWAGVGIVGSIAGCGSDTSATSGGSTDENTEEATATATATDSPTPTDEPEPASFEVVDYKLPEKVEIGEEFSLEITVRNTGEKEGDYSAPIHVRTADSEWQEGGEWSFTDVPPGETETGTVDEPITFDYVQRYEFRLGQSSETAVIQTVSAKISWGQEFQTPEGYRIRIDEPTLQDTYEYEDYDGSISDAEPDSGEQWAFVNVWVKNETGEANFSPLGSDLALLYGNAQSDGETILVNEPIDKGEPFDGGELQPGVERSGWIGYQLPQGLSVSDLVIAWSEDTFEGQIAANWGDF